MRAALLGLLLAFTAVGCAAGGGASSPSPIAAACASPTAAGTRTVAVTSGGARRTARLDLPAAPAGSPVPLIVALHFAGGTGREMAAYTGLSKTANEAGMAVLYPTAAKADHVWRLRDDPAGRTDVRQVLALVQAAHAAACVDLSRAFATGVSNGGGMAARLACTGPPFRAVAPVAPGLKAIAPCPKGAPVGILEVHGLADRVVPYAGSGSAHAGSVANWIAGWKRRNGCSARAATTVRGGRGARVTRTVRGCAVPVVAVTLEGTDHGWPGSGGPFPKHDPTGFDTNAEVVRFFARFPPVPGSHG